MTANPLIAAPVNMSTPLSGTFLLEDCETIASGIRNGDWLEGGMGAFGAVADGMAMAVDPLGSVLAMGFGWLIEHMEPIKGWFNDLTGDAGEVAGFAGTWDNIAVQMQAVSDELLRILGDLDDQHGQFFDTYRSFQGGSAAHAAAAGNLASAMGVAMQIASTIVKIVHDLTRDALSQLAGTAISAALTAACTLGFGTPWAVAQVTTRVSALAARVGKYVTKLIRAIKALLPRLDDAARLFRSLRKTLDDALEGGRTALRTAARKGDDVADALPPGAVKPRPADECIDDLMASGRWQDPGTRPTYLDSDSWGFRLYGDEALEFLGGAKPTLGRSGDAVFMSPLEDLAHIRSYDDAVVHTGVAPSVETAVRNGRDLIGVAVPLDGMSPRVPTYADAHGYEHFLPGGNTAVRSEGGFVVNATREFTIPGGALVPPGSILFRLLRDGSIEPLGVFT